MRRDTLPPPPEASFRDDVDQYHRCLFSDLEAVRVANGRPVRELVQYRGQRSGSGQYWSSTVSHQVAFESRLELARILLADFDPAVRAIASQPFQLRWLDDDGRIRRHIPDLLLIHSDGSATVVDVKPLKKAQEPKHRELIAVTRQFVEARGWAFESWSGTSTVRLANIAELASKRRVETIHTELIPTALEAAATSNTLGEAERRLHRKTIRSLIRPVFLHLLWTHQLKTDLTVPLETTSPLIKGVSNGPHIPSNGRNSSPL